jgi:hypothetical protein
MIEVDNTMMQLFVAGLSEAKLKGLAKETAAKFFKDKPADGLPVALRWTVSDTMGIPRQPFRVFRRPVTLRKPTVKVQAGSINFTPGFSTTWNSSGSGVFRQYVWLAFNLTPSASTSVTVVPLNRAGAEIPGQAVTISAPRAVILRCPGMTNLRLEGFGTMGEVTGVEQRVYANLSDWTEIERVGLPFKAGEVAASTYETGFQGPMPASLGGVEAAKRRLAVAQGLQFPIPGTGDASLPVSAWPVSNFNAFVNGLRSGPNSPMELITTVLKQADDTFVTQRSVTTLITVEGIRQDVPGATADPTQTSNVNIPVLASVILLTASESDAAVSLGFGTNDLPPRGQGPDGTFTLINAELPVATSPGWAEMEYDYMVVAKRRILPGFELEYAALALMRSGPEPASNLTAKLTQTLRPEAQDAQVAASVQLRWFEPLLPQGAVILRSKLAGSSEVLNSKRSAGIGGFDPYVALPLEPEPGQPPPIPQGPSFTDSKARLPFDGVSKNRYAVIALDVFGRWSAWRIANIDLTALPVQLPGLVSVAWSPQVAGAVGKRLPGPAVIDVAWDWEDRKPQAIEVTARMLDSGVPPLGVPASTGPILSGFQTEAGLAPGPSIRIEFVADGTPVVVSGPTGTAVVSIAGAEPVRRYRLSVPAITGDFSAAQRQAFVVYARGFEVVRPIRASEVAGPRIAEADDPFPPPLTFAPPAITWTALPDATGRARGVLTWTQTPGAKYVVYQATEAAVRTALGIEPADAPINLTLPERASELKARLIVEPGFSQAMQMFTRLNQEPILANQTEVDLPGEANSLFVFRVAALSASNVESERSSEVAILAVPRRNVPGTPRLLLRRRPKGIEVIALPTPGVPVAAYRVHRVRTKRLNTDVGLMGPAVYDELHGLWQPHTETNLDGSTLEGMSLLDNQLLPGWSAWHYRVVAIGQHNQPQGQFAGESIASVVRSQYFTHTEAPTVVAAPAQVRFGDRWISFQTDIPMRPSDLGAAAIEVFTMRTDPTTNPVRVLRERVLKLDPSSLTTLDSVSFIKLRMLPPTGTPPVRAARSTLPEANGLFEVGLLIPDGVLTPELELVLTDPLGRRTSTTI